MTRADYAGQARRLLIFEPEAGGHQASHIQHLVNYLLAERPNIEVVFAIGRDLIQFLSPRIRAALEDPEVTCCSLTRVSDRNLRRLRASNLVLRGIYQWFFVRNLARNLSVSHAHVHYFDHAILGAALPFGRSDGITYSGLLFRPNLHYRETSPDRGDRGQRARVSWQDRVKESLYKRMLLNPCIKVVFSFDRYLGEFAIRHFAGGAKMLAVPDPVPVGLEELTGPALPSCTNRVSFLLFGALSERKGVLLTLEALARLPNDVAARCHVVIAGRIDPAIRDIFYAHLESLRSGGNSTHVEVIDRYLDDREIPSRVSSADVILAPYVRHVGSSGVLYWAAGARKPVITQEDGLIGREAREFGLGLTANTLSVADFAAVLAKAIEANGQGLADACGQSRFISGHTPERFAAALLQGMVPDWPEAWSSTT